ncbi:hypothetical protein BH09PSE1_BH09PSE1_17620 [soil metagenome]
MSIATIVVLVFAVLLLGYCAVTGPGREARKVDAAVAAANGKTQAVDTAAREVAADERLADALSTATTKQELSNAVANLPDARPSDRRIALACERLRQQGTDTTALPACVGSPRPAQAGPDH